LVADKGYHSGAVVEQVKELEVRTYIPEKKQAGKRHWKGKQGQQQAVIKIVNECVASMARSC